MERNHEDTHKKEEKPDNMSVLPDIGNVILNIPPSTASQKMNDSSTGAVDTNEVGFLDDISESISSIKDSIIEHSGELIENTVKMAGEIAGGIVDTVSDTMSNIDL